MNEVGWWSNWTELKWLDENTYVMTSDVFGEYFFNRGGFIAMKAGSERSIGLMESEFERRGSIPHLFVQDGEGRAKVASALSAAGYRVADRMSVMQIEDAAFAINDEVAVEEMVEEVREWTETYLLSFYGEKSLLSAALAAVRRAKGLREVSLILARWRGEPVGTVALYRTGSVCGAYCVGTKPGYRNRRVAATMLEYASRLALREGRRMILQTILSDSVEQFYLKLGFRRVYLKDLFVKGAANA